MAHDFSILIKGSPEEMVGKVKKMAHDKGGTFSGTVISGSFSGGGVDGQYEVAGANVKIHLTKGPFYASWAMIEAEIRKFFG